LPALAAPLLPLPPPCRAQFTPFTLLQLRGAKTAAASSAAVLSPGAVPIAAPLIATPSAPLSSVICIVPPAPLAGNDASASTIQRGTTSFDAG
jgi:hypothetical protein